MAIPKIIIREATLDDVSNLVDVAEDAFEQEYKKHSKESNATFFREHMSCSRNGLYVAQDGDNLAGFSYFIPVVRVGTVELVQIGVRKDWQNKGIGTKLLSESSEKYVQKLENKGEEIYAMYLLTSEDNPVGQRLYKKCGFELKGKMDDLFIGKGDVELVLGKILRPDKIYPKNTIWTKDNKNNTK